MKGAAHAGVIATVSARFPAYGPAAQVAKRWISAHMLSSHVGDEVVELLVGYLFLHPGAAEPPTSREVGPGGFCSPNDPMRCKPKSLESNSTLLRGEQYLPGPDARWRSFGSWICSRLTRGGTCRSSSILRWGVSLFLTLCTGMTVTAAVIIPFGDLNYRVDSNQLKRYEPHMSPRHPVNSATSHVKTH
jgi:hypothetical protein